MNLLAHKGEKGFGRAAWISVVETRRPARTRQRGGSRQRSGERFLGQRVAADKVADAFVQPASAPAALTLGAANPAPEFGRFDPRDGG